MPCATRMSIREVSMGLRANSLRTILAAALSSGLGMFRLYGFVGLVPRAGLEPACLAARDFKSLVSAIPPPGQEALVYWTDVLA